MKTTFKFRFLSYVVLIHIGQGERMGVENNYSEIKATKINAL